jgi:hypothetical protein
MTQIGWIIVPKVVVGWTVWTGETVHVWEQERNCDNQPCHASRGSLDVARRSPESPRPRDDDPMTAPRRRLRFLFFAASRFAQPSLTIGDG